MKVYSVNIDCPSIHCACFFCGEGVIVCFTCLCFCILDYMLLIIIKCLHYIIYMKFNWYALFIKYDSISELSNMSVMEKWLGRLSASYHGCIRPHALPSNRFTTVVVHVYSCQMEFLTIIS